MERQPKRQGNAAKTASKLKTKGLKRKLESENDGPEGRGVVYGFGASRRVRASQGCPIEEQIAVLNSVPAGSRSESDRASLKHAAHFLSEIAKNEDSVDLLVGNGAIPALVKHLQLPASDIEGDVILYEHEVEERCACAVSRIAIKDEYAQQFVDEGHLPSLVNLLKLSKEGFSREAANGVIRRSADAIANLAHENNNIKSLVRNAGAIPLLVESLKFHDLKVLTAVAAALRTLAFRNEENKIQIVECDALSALVSMLHYEDTALHYEAVGVIGNLVHSSPDIKKKVLQAGALQPVIRLLRSSCPETQRESALLVGQFAATDSECKAQIGQRGAVAPLIGILSSPDVHLKEMASFALGRLAQDTHNQAGIADFGGILPLLENLDSEHVPLQHNSAFALYGLVENEDNVLDFVKVGGVIKLLETNFIALQTKDCVSKTLERLAEKMCGRVLNWMINLMRVSPKKFQNNIVLGLAHICSSADLKTIFIDNNGLNTLLDLLASGSTMQQKLSSEALSKLDRKAAVFFAANVEQHSHSAKVCLGEEYINNDKCSDITFFVEAKPFYAHKVCLLASSDAFHAMFNGGYREKSASDVEIPNVKWDVFELMMRYIYTGHVNVSSSVAQDLLVVADQYLIDGLKKLCESAIAKDICFDNLEQFYELSETFNAKILKRSCLQFILSNFKLFRSRKWLSSILENAMPDLRCYFNEVLNGPTNTNFET
uniref:BTB domain-containing protein n=1 Tax=Kalanchoe fedtschenkoi TaxID=63787 RepID=A0A7N0ZQL4_KALFE